MNYEQKAQPATPLRPCASVLHTRKVHARSPLPSAPHTMRLWSGDPRVDCGHAYGLYRRDTSSLTGKGGTHAVVTGKALNTLLCTSRDVLILFCVNGGSAINGGSSLLARPIWPPACSPRIRQGPLSGSQENARNSTAMSCHAAGGLSRPVDGGLHWTDRGKGCPVRFNESLHQRACSTRCGIGQAARL